MKYSVQMHGYKYAINGYLGTSTEGLNLASQPAQAVSVPRENVEDSLVVQPHRLS